jgi:hypothetical protein
MKGSPTQKDMMQPSYAGQGEPTYVDKSAEDPTMTFYPSRGQDAPAYVGSNPRYWEYR